MTNPNQIHSPEIFRLQKIIPSYQDIKILQRKKETTIFTEEQTSEANDFDFFTKIFAVKLKI